MSLNNPYEMEQKPVPKKKETLMKKFLNVGFVALTVALGSYVALDATALHYNVSANESFTQTVDAVAVNTINKSVFASDEAARERTLDELVRRNPGRSVFNFNNTEDSFSKERRAELIQVEKEAGTFTNAEKFEKILDNVVAHIKVDNQLSRGKISEEQAKIEKTNIGPDERKKHEGSILKTQSIVNDSAVTTDTVSKSQYLSKTDIMQKIAEIQSEQPKEAQIANVKKASVSKI